MHTLLSTAFQKLKLILGNNARQRVERKQPFVELIIFINTEFHAVARQKAVDFVLMVDKSVQNYPLFPWVNI